MVYKRDSIVVDNIFENHAKIEQLYNYHKL